VSDATGINLAMGTLGRELQNTTAAALASGALQPIATEQEVVEDQGVPFIVRSVSSLARKHAALPTPSPPGSPPPPGKRFDPFLPYDPALLVAELSATHLALLNKFPVVPNHLLIVTRVYEPQENLLTLGDFQALCACLAEIDGLAFYNAGQAAGASQSHKHLQLVPLPLGADGHRVPIEARLGVAGQGATLDRSSMAPLPFAHALAPLGFDGARVAEMAAALHDCYGELRRALAASVLARGAAPLDRTAQPSTMALAYNLLVTRQWMLLVARRCESFQSISVNSLGFAGSLFVRNRQELELVRSRRPMALLEAVGYPILRHSM